MSILKKLAELANSSPRETHHGQRKVKWFWPVVISMAFLVTIVALSFLVQIF